MAKLDDKQKLLQTVAARLRTLRKAAGLTQEQLAEAAGVGPEHLSKIETARRFPSLETLIRLASALSAEPADLIGRPGRDARSERADRIDAVLSSLCDDDAEFIESEVLNWVARLRRAQAQQ